ncbi:heavy-metal-associated domain-containing protein [Tissierella creatinophila]|uniref:Copper chaperone CopZ n=1 Tax=Tissierella creatinophila DSM 6911 TaxID=1123403 RepID=A0A1U7M8A8_TISCR|nr:cation transporter [Tissierella creatinophila]OLS03449.1 copper chaperone CopZ [Tissierella creatinophila DSM 6911]
MKKTLIVEGMSCSHCENAVKNALRELPEVLDVEVDLAQNKVEVEGSDLEDSRLKEAIDEAGYELVSID